MSLPLLIVGTGLRLETGLAGPTLGRVQVQDGPPEIVVGKPEIVTIVTDELVCVMH